MNFIKGSLKNGEFKSASSSIVAAGLPDEADVQLGVRAEDIEIVNLNNANVVANVYSVEPTGEATLIVVTYEEAMIVIKAEKSNRPAINSEIGLKFEASSCRFFRISDGQRLRVTS